MSEDSVNQPDLSSITGGHAFLEAPRLRSAILYFIARIPQKLTRVALCKLLYYADGHFFQKYQRTITENPYLHIEGSPMPLFFNEIMHDMINAGQIEVIPHVVTEMNDNQPIMVLKGLVYKALVDSNDKFQKPEKKVLSSVASVFQSDLSLETRYYPNLYQGYAQTDLYKQIVFEVLPEGKRPKLSFKAWAGKIFHLKMQ